MSSYSSYDSGVYSESSYACSTSSRGGESTTRHARRGDASASASASAVDARPGTPIIRRKKSMEQRSLRTSSSRVSSDVQLDPPPVPNIPTRYLPSNTPSTLDTGNNASTTTGPPSRSKGKTPPASKEPSSYVPDPSSHSQSQSHSHCDSRSHSRPRALKTQPSSFNFSQLDSTSTSSSRKTNPHEPTGTGTGARTDQREDNLGLLPLVPARDVPFHITQLTDLSLSLSRTYLQRLQRSSSSTPHSNVPTHPHPALGHAQAQTQAQAQTHTAVVYPTIKFETDHLSRYIDAPEHVSHLSHNPHLPHNGHDGDAGGRPDGLVFPEMLLRLDRWGRYGGWLRRLGRYGVGVESGGSDVREWGRDGWEEEEEGREEKKLPDLFSTSHRIATQSNGRTIIVTLFRPVLSPSSPSRGHATHPPDPTHIYITPCIGADVKKLGQAGARFREVFGFLENGVGVVLARGERGCGRGRGTGHEGREGGLEERDGWDGDGEQRNGEEDWFSVVQEAVGGETRRTVDYPTPVLIPSPLASSPHPISLNKETVPTPAPTATGPAPKENSTIHPVHLQYLISQTARILAPEIPLDPASSERFGSYGVVFHTFERACVGLFREEHEGGFEGSAKSEGKGGMEGRSGIEDGAKDMQFISATTGGMACTFIYHLTPSPSSSSTSDPHVTTTIHPSWHFWSQQHKDLIDLSNTIYQAILPSLVVPEIVKRTLKAANVSLPPRPSVEEESGGRGGRGKRMVFPELRYKRCRLTAHPPEFVWPSFPDKSIRDLNTVALAGMLRQAQLRKRELQNNAAGQASRPFGPLLGPVGPVSGLGPLRTPATPATPTRKGVFTPRPFVLGT